MPNASKGQGGPRTMNAEREAEDRVLRLSPRPCSGRTAALLRAYAELDAEREAHARTLAIMAEMLFDVGMLNHEMRAMREKYLGTTGASVASSAVGIMAQRVNRHIAVDSAANDALSAARSEVRP